MKKLLVAIGVFCIFCIPSIPYAGQFKVRTDTAHVYKVWCRHDALYWGSIVGEDLQVRVAIGFYNNGEGDQLHAQPQVKLLNEWHFFTMRPKFIAGEAQDHMEMIFISMPKQQGHTWKLLYNITWAEFTMIQNTWMIQKNGKSYERRKKLWNKKMNRIIEILREKEDADQ